ncbi:zona pellucida sperm-binding protein 3-like [Triplophysa rosa]|uniref:Zona pellucida sperm-binding protein 3 n=1 Tax=Triplophysa rosa TaxID=992332 RepID=A0A9W8C8N9_TRIRA|nr:zona pellucida sperm-binding protein 3-like [Triplophysa rosa]KAI7811060.1 egg envelope protein [Triplophysa rosa]
MERSTKVIGFILIISLINALLCHSELVNHGQPSFDKGSGQNAIFRRPLVPGPPRPDQNLLSLASNALQNRIHTRGPAASWRAAPAMAGPPSQGFIQIPMQVQSQSTSYAPVQSQMNSRPEQRHEYPTQIQQKPMPGPVLQPVVKDEVVMQSTFEPKTPVPANSVGVRCGEVSVKVHAQQDFLGNGQFIDPSDLTLGGCPFVGFDHHARIVVFESALQDCGSTLTMTEDTLVYSFALVYSTSPVPNTPIVKTNDATVAIHCIYPRKHNVSSHALRPAWIPYAALKTGEDHLQLSLKLMTDDWKFQRPSSTYFLEDFINLEASVVRANHAPLRVFVESCAATSGPSGNAATVYTFIENSGCMTDAKLTGSRSTFMPRIQEDKLQFQIEAFRFKQDHSGTIYITCHLRATATSSPIDSVHKACSFVLGSNSWVAASGEDHLCGCCETSCAVRKGRSLDAEDATLEDEATVGPIFVMQTPPSENEHLLIGNLLI